MSFFKKIFSVVPKYYDKGHVKFDVLKIFGKNCLYIYRGYNIGSGYADKFNEYFSNNDMLLKVKNLKQGMDEISCNYIDHFMYLSKFWGKYLRKGYWSNYDKNLINKYTKMEQINPIPKIATFRGLAFYNRYGLVDLPKEIIDSLNGKDIIDAGGCDGDTALIFHDLFPASKIYVYEPLSVYLNNVKNIADKINSSNDEKIIPVHKGLSDKQEITNIKFNNYSEDSEITTIDKDYQGDNLGLIKMDTEGYESFIVKGGEEVIKKYKPVMVVAIYHTPEDFFDMKDKLKKLNPDYRFMIRRSEFLHPTIEYVLIAY